MTMVIQSFFNRTPESQLEPLGTKVRYPNAGGWESPQAYVKECSKRFKHRNPRPYKNGLEMDGEVGTTQRVWFES